MRPGHQSRALCHTATMLQCWGSEAGCVGSRQPLPFHRLQFSRCEQGWDLRDGRLPGKSPSYKETAGLPGSVTGSHSVLQVTWDTMPGCLREKGALRMGRTGHHHPEARPSFLVTSASGDAHSSSRLLHPSLFLQEVSLFIPLLPFLLAKIFPSHGQSHSGTADPWALLRWLRSLDADFYSE